jgi:hypothetical protein
MNMDPHMEMIDLVKSLSGRYKQSDKEMVVEVINDYKEKHKCSYQHAYDMTVEGSPSFSAYTSWRRKLNSKD